MRYVDIGDLRLEDGWPALAEAACRDVMENGTSIADHDGIWRDTKKGLGALLHEKCWFCETPVDRADNAVDHFRPKGRVADALQKHSGYRWLSFEIRNFRFACTFCNSRRVDVENGTAGGKADRFPLVDEGARVYAVDPAQIDYNDLIATVEAEKPAILDPCAPSDWLLLGCKRENGRPCATSGDPLVIRRVEQSIEVYHLDYEPTCKRRHTTAGQLLEKVREAKKAFLRIDETDIKTSQFFTNLYVDIIRMIRVKAAFSGEMHFLIQGQRSPDHPWIENVLSTGG